MEDTDVTAFCEYYEKVCERTLRVARCIPAGKLNVSTPPLYGLTEEEVQARSR